VRPLEMRLVGLRHVRRDRGVSTSHVAASVRGDASAVMEDLDRGRREPYVDHFMDQGKGHGVIVAGKFQMIVNVDPGDLPFAVHKRRCR
jgi:hypothetical protein